MISRVILASVVAGAVAGIALTAFQFGAVTPLLVAAESYEAGEANPAPIPHPHGEITHSHAAGDRAHGHDGHAVMFGDDATAPAAGGTGDGSTASAPVRGDAAPHDGHAHDHGAAWAPADGFERTFWTAVSNVATGVGFALLLVAVFAWRGGASWRQGVLWGAAGFFVFFVNPAIGLRPAIPGAFGAELLDRQLWWLLAVACSAAGAGLLLLAPRAVAKVGGAVLIVVPHLAGAPHPVFKASEGLAPAGLADSFVVATAATNAAFWLLLGFVAATAFTRFSRR